MTVVGISSERARVVGVVGLEEAVAVVVAVVFVLVAYVVWNSYLNNVVPDMENPFLSVNFHFTRQCNYECKFCFHRSQGTQKDTLEKEQIRRGLNKLKKAGTKKINFSGGEPFLHMDLLGFMVDYCKETLEFESVTIVSNGSKINNSKRVKNWFSEHAKNIDYLAISCESADPYINELIGRKDKRSADQTENAKRVAKYCRQYGIAFKLNTVVNKFNKDDNLSDLLRELKPKRWKVFQCLEIKGENSGEGVDDRRDFRDCKVTKQEYEDYIHRHTPEFENILKSENNKAMLNSYVILDEKMRFLNCAKNQKIPGESILDVSVKQAYSKIKFDFKEFKKRDGMYEDVSWKKQCIPDIEDMM